MTDYTLVKDYTDGDLTEFAQLGSPGWTNDAGVMKSAYPDANWRALYVDEVIHTNGCLRLEFELQPQGATNDASYFMISEMSLNGVNATAGDPGPWNKGSLGVVVHDGVWSYANTPQLGTYTILYRPLGVDLEAVWTPMVLTIENCIWTLEIDGVDPVSVPNANRTNFVETIGFNTLSDTDHWVRNLKIFRPADIEVPTP